MPAAPINRPPPKHAAAVAMAALGPTFICHFPATAALIPCTYGRTPRTPVRQNTNTTNANANVNANANANANANTNANTKMPKCQVVNLLTCNANTMESGTVASPRVQSAAEEQTNPNSLVIGPDIDDHA